MDEDLLRFPLKAMPKLKKQQYWQVYSLLENNLKQPQFLSLMLLLLILLLVSLLTIIFIFLKDILSLLNTRLQIMRYFLHQNSGIFALLFILIFFIEQILLLFAAFYLGVDSQAQLLIGIFALIVLTTAAIEKFILEKKNQYLASKVGRLSYDNEQNLQEMKKIYDYGKKIQEENMILKLQLKEKR